MKNDSIFYKLVNKTGEIKYVHHGPETSYGEVVDFFSKDKNRLLDTPLYVVDDELFKRIRNGGEHQIIDLKSRLQSARNIH